MPVQHFVNQGRLVQAVSRTRRTHKNVWPWHLTYDLDIEWASRDCQGTRLCKISSSELQRFTSYRANSEKENLATMLKTILRAVIITGDVLVAPPVELRHVVIGVGDDDVDDEWRSALRPSAVQSYDDRRVTTDRLTVKTLHQPQPHILRSFALTRTHHSSATQHRLYRFHVYIKYKPS